MKAIRVMRYRNEDDYHDYKKALEKAKEHTAKAHRAIEKLCELTEDMEDEYGERDDEESYEEREMRKRGGRRY